MAQTAIVADFTLKPLRAGIRNVGNKIERDGITWRVRLAAAIAPEKHNIAR